MTKILISGIFGALVLGLSTVISAAKSSVSGRLDGTWDVVVQPRVCANNSVITTFQAAYYFEPGGVEAAGGVGSYSADRAARGWEDYAVEHRRERDGLGAQDDSGADH